MWSGRVVALAATERFIVIATYNQIPVDLGQVDSPSQVRQTDSRRFYLVNMRMMKVMGNPRAAPKKPLAPYMPSVPPSSTGGS